MSKEPKPRGVQQRVADGRAMVTAFWQQRQHTAGAHCASAMQSSLGDNLKAFGDRGTLVSHGPDVGLVKSCRVRPYMQAGRLEILRQSCVVSW